jgi:hypothetical protein
MGDPDEVRAERNLNTRFFSELEHAFRRIPTGLDDVDFGFASMYQKLYLCFLVPKIAFMIALWSKRWPMLPGFPTTARTGKALPSQTTSRD